MQPFARLTLLSALLLSVAACGGRSEAPTLPDGKKLTVMVYIDGAPAGGGDTAKMEQVETVVDWMKPDLVQVLKNAGYDAGAVADPNTPVGPGSYLLRVQILEYRGGSKAARMFVGFGAGAASLNTHFELIGAGNKSYVSGSPGAGTSRVDWQHLARKANLEITDSVNARLHQSL